jgi:hypothetical protein
MIDYLWLAIGLLAAGFLACRGGRVWVDADRRGFALPARIRMALQGAVAPSHYWWGARIEALDPQEQHDLLAHETDALGLSRADSLLCPLCGVEVPHAWGLTAQSQPTVALGPIECPRCDFRLDTCRHCAHFLPGRPQSWGQLPWAQDDPTTGRCNQYRAWQPVEQATSPDMARQMKARGYDRIRAPTPIVDSYLPPDFCTAFKPEHRRLQVSRVSWPDARRVALLRLAISPSVPGAVGNAKLPAGDEEWLL